MERNSQKINKKKVRTWGFAAGATLLLAVLTLVLCLMGGVFDFKAPDETDAPAPLSTPVVTLPPDVSEPTDAPAEVVSISAVCGDGGVMSPAGLVEAAKGGSITFTITPDEGFELYELKVDGRAVEKADSYTFSNVTENHSIYAVFRETEPEETESPSPSPTPTATPTPAPTPTAPPPTAPVGNSSPTDLG